MSLLGLSLAIGMLIDDAIVVRENIVRHMEMGKDHYRRARGDRRDRTGGHGDDVLHRCRVRSHRVHARDRGAVVRAVRADDRVRGARVALRVVLARPDALGVLGGSADRGTAGAAIRWRAHSGASMPVRSPDRSLQARDRRGRSTTASSMVLHRDVRDVRGRARSCTGVFGGFGFVPTAIAARFNVVVETPPGSNLEYTRMQSRRDRAARCASPR